jgi:hypothetical protein
VTTGTRRPTIVTATGVEYRAARAALAGRGRVIRAGIALDRCSEHIEGLAISCGVAGGLRRDLPAGTVLIPRRVERPDGSTVVCDEAAVDALVEAARRLGYEPVTQSLATRITLVKGAERESLAERGFAGADMESGFIDADRLACVRVILDTPHREISSAWLKPMSAVICPDAWRDLPFLLREGPRCAALAARIVAASAML